MEQPFQKSGEREQAAPPPHKFDKLRAVRNLIDEKIPEKQAMAVVETIADARDGLATQAGMEKMETSLRGDMHNEIEKSELRIRADMERIRADMEKIRADIQAEFKRFYWYIPVVMGAVIGILKFT
ncbi:MAG: hypothetical protein OXG03_00945 [Gammaproteobacteria bacterium]|nr:hypothetical protein [Gammaproteobacteria bacterium]